MNFYAERYIGYNEDYTQSSDKLFSIIEGVYESNLVQKARVVGHLNLTNNTFYKFVKQPYTVTDMNEHAITLKRHGYNSETDTLFKTKTYFLLEELLRDEGVLQLRI
jgi:hypothetical protein